MDSTNVPVSTKTSSVASIKRLALAWLLSMAANIHTGSLLFTADLRGDVRCQVT